MKMIKDKDVQRQGRTYDPKPYGTSPLLTQEIFHHRVLITLARSVTQSVV